MRERALIGRRACVERTLVSGLCAATEHSGAVAPRSRPGCGSAVRRGRLGVPRASTRLRPVGPVCAASAAVARGDARAARAPAHAPGPAGTDGREWASFEPEPVRCAFKTLKEMDS